MATSTDSPSTTNVLPSIHEMFPDHLLPKSEYQSSRPRSHRGHSYPHSPNVHHTANHRDRAHEPQCTCTHTGCPRHALDSLDSRIVSLSQGDCMPQSSNKRRPSSSLTSPCQNIYAFNSLRPPCPSANKQSSSPAFRADVLPSPASSSGRDDYAECYQYQDRRSAPSYASSSDGYASHSASLQRTRASVEGDPRTAISSFPLSHPGLPLPPSATKHHQYPQRRSASGAGIQGAGDSYSAHGTFHLNEGLGNEEEDDGNSGTEENDTTNGKKHVCPTCFKRFNRPSSLRIHVNTHTGATPFRCPWPNCGREFNVNSNMRRHYRNHATPGFSRSQNATSVPAPSANGPPTPPTTTPNPPTDGRRKRRRVNIPPSQIPATGNAHGAMAPSSHPHPHSHPYPPLHASHRSEFDYRHTPQVHPHGGAHSPHFSSSSPSSSSSQPHAVYPARSAYPQGLHPGSNLTQMHMPSPPISNLSISEEDEYTSGSESDASDAKYLRSSRSRGTWAAAQRKGGADGIAYDEDEGIDAYDEREHLTRSLARVAVEPVAYDRGQSAYSPHVENARAHRDRPRFSTENPDAPYHPHSGRRGKGYDANSGTRPLTPGSSFHSSSPSPSVSPSPLPSPPLSSQANFKYSPSTPYHRSLTDVRVSTTLRPAFAASNERERV